MVKLVPRNRLLSFPESVDIRELRFELVNMPMFRVQVPGALQPNRTILTYETWEIEISPAILTNTDTFRPSSPYRLTHSILVKTAANQQLTTDEARTIIEGLHVFFSFAFGQLVGTMSVKGMDEAGSLVWQEWGVRSTDLLSSQETWFNRRIYGSLLAEAFPKFMQQWTDPLWRDVLRSTVYWYTRAVNVDHDIDGPILLTQAALELLAWKVGFKKGNASARLRRLLERYEIPVSIPSGLVSIARHDNWKDGPDAFTAIRNSLTHPKLETELPIAEAWTLGVWYLELILLAICGYSGVYSNRTAHFPCANQVETVPWAK